MATSGRLTEIITHIPIIDNHCHSLLRTLLTLGPTEFRGCFSETGDARQREHHLSSGLTYRLALHELAGLFGCSADESAILERRAGVNLGEHVTRLVRDGAIRGLLVDTGFLRQTSFDSVELRQLVEPAGCQVWPILRLEVAAEDLVPTVDSLDGLEQAFIAKIRSAPADGFVGLKSIIAYRSGLAIAPPDRSAAADAFERLRRSSTERMRLTDKALLDYLLWVALAEAAALHLPVQFHCGFGDTDLDLREANPLHLRPILETSSLAGAPIVLLHCYPYVREAAYLANVYSHVSFDLSLAVPFLGAGAVPLFSDALAMAPSTKLLYGSDGFSIPELHWLGARWGRRALAEALERWGAWGLPDSELERVAERVLYRNAIALYDLTLDPPTTAQAGS
jgi:predicted TIM-barrel fold metal-dependent hydrolase